MVINRAIEEVFAFTTDYDAHLKWQAGILEAEVTSEIPLKVGSDCKHASQLVGRKIDTTGETTEHQPPSRHGWMAAPEPCLAEGLFTFDAVEGGARVTFSVEAGAGGFFKLAEPLLTRMPRRQFETSLHNLKDVFEVGA